MLGHGCPWVRLLVGYLNHTFALSSAHSRFRVGSHRQLGVTPAGLIAISESTQGRSPKVLTLGSNNSSRESRWDSNTPDPPHSPNQPSNETPGAVQSKTSFFSRPTFQRGHWASVRISHPALDHGISGGLPVCPERYFERHPVVEPAGDSGIQVHLKSAADFFHSRFSVCFDNLVIYGIVCHTPGAYWYA